MDFAEFSLGINILIFLIAGAVIVVTGTMLAGLADRLADRTGMGEAMTGALLLGASTSLPGITTSVTAAWDGHPSLAMSNAIGGIAAQTAFLAVADFFNRDANLEHQAASITNILNGSILIALLAGLLIIADSPSWAFFGVHPGTPILFAAYLYGIRLARRSHEDPQWHPHKTRFTRKDEPEADHKNESLALMFTKFALFALAMGAAGWFIAQSGIAIAAETGIDETVVGGLFTAVVTSLPELITAVAAVRRGALQLAVGDIIGGNCFDVMFAVAADVAYRGGSIYHAIGSESRFLIALAIAMTTILVAGLVSREKRGIANIGFESFLILVFYVGGFLLIAFT